MSDPAPPPAHVERFSAWVLRTGSAQGLDRLASWATGGRQDAAALVALARGAGGPRDNRLDPGPLAWFGHTLLLAADEPDTAQDALAVLDLLVDRFGSAPLEPAHAAAYAQALLRAGRITDAEQVRTRHELPPMVDWALRADAANPALGGADVGVWLSLLGEPFRAAGLEPPSLADGRPPTFDALVSPAAPVVDDTDRVTVVMSAYRPDRDILVAASSVLASTWRNLELLVVDDGTPPGYEDVFGQVLALDDRVRLVRSERNRGTYAARNLGLREATGRYVTNHDSDDWMHPRRLERQVAVLREDPRLLACRSWALRALPDLTLTYVGYPPHRINAASIMLRHPEVRGLVGGFDEVRKSADMELPNRLKAVRKGSVLDLGEDQLLQISQLTPGSLSRRDARPGWTHWSRIAYRDAYTTWHARIREGRAPALAGPGVRRPFPVPEPSWAPHRAAAPAAPTFDVVVVNDWRVGRGSQAAVLDLARTLGSQGLRVALSTVESPVPLARTRDRARRELHELLRLGRVPLVHPEQELVAHQVLVTVPEAFTYLPGAPVAWQVGSVSCLVHRDVPEDLARADANLARWLGRPPTWSPQPGLDLADAPGDRLVPTDLLRSVPPPAVRPHRRSGATRPALGHDLPDEPGSWPGTRADLEALYLAPGEYDVLLAHPVRTALRILGRESAPPHWLGAGEGGVHQDGFLTLLDFYLAVAVETDLEVPALRAVAAGCVPVLDDRWEPVFGGAALYATPATALREVLSVAGDPSRLEQLRAEGAVLLGRRARHTVEQVRTLARHGQDGATGPGPSTGEGDPHR